MFRNQFEQERHDRKVLRRSVSLVKWTPRMLEQLTNFALGLGENCGFEIVAGAPVETASGPSIAVLAAQRLRALRKRTKQAKSMRSRTLKTLPRAA